jgi:hypothetical protein
MARSHDELQMVSTKLNKLRDNHLHKEVSRTSKEHLVYEPSNLYLISDFLYVYKHRK